MELSSTSSSRDLLVALDRTSTRPLHVQLEGALRDAIHRGRLVAGTRLPSTRALARDLGVSRGLVVESYAQLEAEGYLRTRPGSGTVVAAPASRWSPPVAVPRERAPAPRWDLRPNVPDLTAFPRSEWATALRLALSSIPATALGYGDPRGAVELREALASYLGRVRGALADPECIIVCSGFAQARSLFFRLLRDRGARSIGLEDPGPPQSREVASRAGVEPVALPVDEQGLVVDELDRAGPDAVVATPAHQFPSGAVMAPPRRLALLEWARRRGALVLEDDYDAEFRYDREPVGALQGLAPDLVLYAGSLSKALAPGLRIGWLLCPPNLVEELTEAKRLEDLGAPIVEQLALADYLASGRFDRHLRRVRVRYRRRRTALHEALRRYAPQVRLSGIAAGLHAVAALPPDVDAHRVVERARDREVGLCSMSDYRASRNPRPPALVLGYGAVSESVLDAAIRLIADLLS